MFCCLLVVFFFFSVLFCFWGFFVVVVFLRQKYIFFLFRKIFLFCFFLFCFVFFFFDKNLFFSYRKFSVTSLSEICYFLHMENSFTYQVNHSLLTKNVKKNSIMYLKRKKEILYYMTGSNQNESKCTKTIVSVKDILPKHISMTLLASRLI